MDSDDDAKKLRTKVGYGSPPVSTRFQPGKSGNPAGRPRGSKNLATLVRRAMYEKVTITENGRRRTVTKLEAAVKQIVNKAAMGDSKAFRQLQDLLQHVEESQGVQAIEKDALQASDREVMAGILKRFGIEPGEDRGGSGQSEKA